MTPEQLNADLLAVQECESLGACVGRGQKPETYQDIVEKLRGHADKLPDDRKQYWTDQAAALGVELYPAAEEPTEESTESEQPRRRGRPKKVEA